MQWANRYAEQLVDATVEQVTRERRGDPVGELVAASRDADLLVIGMHRGRPVRSMLRGSIPERVLAEAHCPVVLVPQDWRPSETAGVVVVGIASDESSDAAVEFAVGDAAARGRELELVHAWRVPVESIDARETIGQSRERARTEHERTLADRLDELESRFSTVVAHRSLREGTAAEALAVSAPRAELLVVGMRTHPSANALLTATTARRTATRTAVPICVVPVSASRIPRPTPSPQRVTGPHPDPRAGHLSLDRGGRG